MEKSKGYGLRTRRRTHAHNQYKAGDGTEDDKSDITKNAPCQQVLVYEKKSQRGVRKVQQRQPRHDTRRHPIQRAGNAVDKKPTQCYAQIAHRQPTERGKG